MSIRYYYIPFQIYHYFSHIQPNLYLRILKGGFNTAREIHDAPQGKYAGSATCIDWTQTQNILGLILQYLMISSTIGLHLTALQLNPCFKRRKTVLPVKVSCPSKLGNAYLRDTGVSTLLKRWHTIVFWPGLFRQVTPDTKLTNFNHLIQWAWLGPKIPKWLLKCLKFLCPALPRSLWGN